MPCALHSKLPLPSSQMKSSSKKNLILDLDGPPIDSLAGTSKEYYGSEGYITTEAMGGIDAAHGWEIRLYISTNKRLPPTRLILDHLGWSDLFASAYALTGIPQQGSVAGRVTKGITDDRCLEGLLWRPAGRLLFRRHQRPRLLCCPKGLQRRSARLHIGTLDHLGLPLPSSLQLEVTTC